MSRGLDLTPVYADSTDRFAAGRTFDITHHLITTADLIAGGGEVAVELNGADDVLIWSSVPGVFAVNAQPVALNRKVTKQGAGTESYGKMTQQYWRIRRPLDRISFKQVATQLGRHGHIHVWAGFQRVCEVPENPLAHALMPHRSVTYTQTIASGGVGDQESLSDAFWNVGGQTPTDIWITEAAVMLRAASGNAAGTTSFHYCQLIKADTPAGDTEPIFAIAGMHGLPPIGGLFRPGVPIHIPLKDMLDTRSAGAGDLAVVFSGQAAAVNYSIFWVFNYLYML